MNPLELLIAFARMIIDLHEQHAGQPTYDLEFLADQLGVDPVAAEWLVSALASIKTRKPMVYVATVERPGASDSDSVIVAYTDGSLKVALEDEDRLFHAGLDDEDTYDFSQDDEDRVVTDYEAIDIQ